MANAKAERRRYKRVAVELPIKITYAQSEINASVKNISNLGAGLEIKTEIPPNSHVKVIISIPAFARIGIFTKHIECEGTIIRCEPLKGEAGYNLGIFFTNFSHEGDKKLSRYLDYLISQDKRKGEKWLKKRQAKK